MTATGFRMRHGRHWSPVTGTAVTYTSGAATNVPTGLACKPGQPGTTPANLRSARTAFSCSGRSPLPAVSVSWNAIVTVALGAGSLAGSYAGTIVHSVY